MNDEVQTPRPRGGVGSFLVKAVALVAILMLAVLAGLWAVDRYVEHRLSPDPETIATASLQGLREQNKLSAFETRFVAVVTSKQTRFGLSAERTLIMPGTVRYEVDLGKLSQRDLKWDAATKTLTVTLPPLEVDPPEIDMAAIRQYGSGGLLMHFSDAQQQLDQANRLAGQKELVQQAHAPTPMTLARRATMRAVSQSFALPLRAAGVEASVKVGFAGTPESQWDVTKPIPDVLRDAS
ncbi:MAG: DUF4230 domain-containing protein [Sphingomonas sp.]